MATQYHGWDELTFPSETWQDTIGSIFSEIDEDVVIRGTSNDKPTAGTSDRLYLETDTLSLYYDDGSEWNQIQGGGSSYTDEDAQDAVNELLTASGRITLTYDDPNDQLNIDGFSGDHADLSGIGSDDHHTKYSDSEAVSAVNNDADHGSTASHNYFSGSHTDLTNISSDDHHAKYTDNEAVSAVEGASSLTLNGSLQTGEDITTPAGDLLWDDSNTYIPQARLENDTVTVAGNAVSLGSSITIGHGDLSSIASDDHHAKTNSASELSEYPFGNGDIDYFKLTDKHDSLTFLPFKNMWQYEDVKDRSSVSVTDTNGNSRGASAMFDGTGSTFIGPNADEYPITIEVDYSPSSWPSLAQGDAEFVASLYPYNIAQYFRVDVDNPNWSQTHTVYETSSNTESVCSSGSVQIYDLEGESRHPTKITIVLDDPDASGDTNCYIKGVYCIRNNSELIGEKYLSTDGNGMMYGSLNMNSHRVYGVPEVTFENTEGPSTNRSIRVDDSEGVLFKDHNGNTYPLWMSENVNAGTDINISGGSGASDTPVTINHGNTSSASDTSSSAGAAITDVDIDGRGHVTSLGTTTIDHDSTVGGTDSDAHHSKYTDGEARSAVEGGNLNKATFTNFEIVDNATTNSLDFNYIG